MPGGIAPAQTWWVKTADGVRLRACHWPADAPCAHALFFNGRTEFIEKVSAPAAELVRRGISVVSLDWRGQGLSDRLLDEPLKGHVGDFADFQTDVDAFLADPRVAGLPGKRLLVGHSMGGMIGAAALLRPEVGQQIHATIFSAPMFGVALSPAMRAAASVTMTIGGTLGKHAAWPPFGDMQTPYALQDVPDNVLTQDQDIWDWMVQMARDHPRTSIAAPTLGWFIAATKEIRRMRSAARPVCPTLCLLGSQESVVDPKAVTMRSKAFNAELHEIEGGLHELLIERPDLRQMTWDAIDAFLRSQDVLREAA